jgi:arsenical pump membrane protein
MMAAASRGRPKRLLACVFVAGAAATAVLSLDATVVLLTPVVFATAATLRLRSKPGVYASLHLANSASLLLPVSNLTNLLAFRATKLSFPRFGLVMALPWLAAIGVEWLLLSRFFASDLQGQGEVQKTVAVGAASTYALVVLGVTLVGFMLTAVIHIDPAIVAAAGAVLLAGPALARHRVGLGTLVRAVDIPFLLFVASLAILVRVVSAGGLQGIISPLVPGGTSLWSLLAVAGLAAVLANILNNLPAILILLPAASAAGVPAILAALIGVNVGANLTYVGSLATLLWRRLLRERRVELSLGEFLRLGTLTVPATLLASCVALWLSVRIIR